MSFWRAELLKLLGRITALEDSRPFYDAVVDGGADNTGAASARGALQRALTAATLVGKPLYIPSGIYRFDTGQYLNPPSNSTIIGAPGAKLRKVTDEAVPLIYVPSGNPSRIRISGLTFEYTAPTTLVTGGGNAAMYLIGCKDVIVEDCLATGAFYVGFNISEGSEYTFRDCKAVGFINRGFYPNAGQGGTTSGTLKHVKFIGCVADGLTVGDYGFNTNCFGTATGADILFEGCVVLNVDQHAFSASERMSNVKFKNCHAESLNVGFLVQKANTFRGSRTILEGCTTTGGVLGFYVTESDYVELTGCNAWSASSHGFQAVDSQYITHVNCKAIQNGGNGFNVLSSGAALSSRNDFSGCTANLNTGYGISIEANAAFPHVPNDNNFVGNTAGATNILSASVILTLNSPGAPTLSSTGDVASLTTAVSGHTAPLTNAGVVHAFQALATFFTGFVAGCFSSTASHTGLLTFYRSLSGVLGTATVVASGTVLGKILWLGAQQTGTFATQSAAASIRAVVDGVVTSGAGGDMPGALYFATTPDGSLVDTDRLKIDNQGFVNVMGGSFGRATPVTKTADFTVAVTENNIISNRAATNTATLPAAASFTGREIIIKTITAQTVVSASSNVVPLAGGAAAAAILAATAGKWAVLVSDGTNWVIMTGN